LERVIDREEETMRGRLWLLVLLTPLLLAGMCEDESPTGTGTPVPDPTLDNLWPNADGASWTYALNERVWGDATVAILYDTPDEVPSAPSLDEVAALLADHPHGSVESEDAGTFALHFDGEITTDSGMEGQNLVETLTWAAKPGPPRVLAADALLRRILAVRPDLRARAIQLGLRVADETGSRDGFAPLFLQGYAWLKTSEFIGSYGDLDQLLAWKYLESNLSIGHEFSQQLVPELADDVWLHARILSVGRVDTPAGHFRKVLTCLYTIDYGIMQVSSQQDPLLGYARMLDYGTVSYAPAVGPVRSYERKLVAVGDGGALGPGIGDLELSITETSEGR
jgi:hypothetical protein